MLEAVVAGNPLESGQVISVGQVKLLFLDASAFALSSMLAALDSANHEATVRRRGLELRVERRDLQLRGFASDELGGRHVHGLTGPDAARKGALGPFEHLDAAACAAGVAEAAKKLE